MKHEKQAQYGSFFYNKLTRLVSSQIKRQVIAEMVVVVLARRQRKPAAGSGSTSIFTSFAVLIQIGTDLSMPELIFMTK